MAFNEDLQSVITLNYTDVESDQALTCTPSNLSNITVTQACACAVGVCTVGVTGTLNYFGAASFDYVVSDGLSSNVATATLAITAVNDAPVALDITPPVFNEDTQSVITLSYTDVESDSAVSCTPSNLSNITVTQACACAAGVCTVGVTGTLYYNGAASFDYVVSDGDTSNVATATLTIGAVNNAPVAANVTPASFLEDTQSVITLSYTDIESNQATSCSPSNLSNISVTQACACLAGVCTVGVTGSLNYFGAASFDYTVSDGAVSNIATGTLLITAVNDAPLAANITPPGFNEDTESIITLSYTDVELNFATVCTPSNLSNVTVTSACACAAGVCTVGVTGLLNYNGAASFDYTVSDGDVSNVATATLVVGSVNDAPIASAISPPAFNEDTQSVITLSYSDTESNQATTCVLSALVNVTETQSCACLAGVCTVGVTGVLNYNGAASFNYLVNDGANSNVVAATLTIDPVNDAPVTSDFSPASFGEDLESIITLSYTDVDGAGNATSCTPSSLSNITVTQACACTLGVCTVGVTGTLNYTGAASFDFAVNDGLASNVSTATLSIGATNDAPVANNITPVSFNEDTQSIITLSYTDAESNQATSCSPSNLSNISVTQACACAAGVCTVGVTGSANYFGAASFDYTVNDGDVSNVATATLTIDPVNDAPVANDITPVAFNEDAQSIITLSYTDIELNNATSCTPSALSNITVTQACACAAGVCTVGVTGTLNYSGAASFDYTVNDGDVSNVATATLTIGPTNDAPVASDLAWPSFNEDTQSIVTLSYTDAESNNAASCSPSNLSNVTVTQACSCLAGVCTVGVTGTFNYNGAASFDYTVSMVRFQMWLP